MENLAYSLDGDKVVSRIATPEELDAARKAARAILDKDPAGWAMRSCWVCNGAHTYFLNDLTDGFLFGCIMGCGHFYYQGIDITEFGDANAEAQD